MNIGNTANHSGVPAKTIRHCESIRLIAPSGGAASDCRLFGERDVQTTTTERREQ